MSELIRYGVMSDTHGRVPKEIFQVFEGVRRIYHCGDVGPRASAREIETIAPLRAVCGNMDSWEMADLYGESVVEDAEFGTVIVYHGTCFGHNNDSIVRGLLAEYGPSKPRVILFGHSHVPLIETHKGILFLNPGSASYPRSGANPSVALLEYDPAAKTLSARHLFLPKRSRFRLPF